MVCIHYPNPYPNLCLGMLDIILKKKIEGQQKREILVLFYFKIHEVLNENLSLGYSFSYSNQQK